MVTNFPDYNGYETLDSFASKEALESYRHMLLEKTEPQVDFIRRHVPYKYDAPRVMEIGCGNGRLLVGLDNAGLLRDGSWGIDLSESRIKFAQDWVEWIDFECGNILDVPTEWFSPGRFDLAVCITGCFQYFYPASPDAPQEVLARMRCAKYALFELYRKPPMGRTWKELPPGDPWRFIMQEHTDVGDWVHHRKIFVGDGDPVAVVDIREENLAYYELPVFLGHLHKAGFKNVHWAKQNSTTQVVLVS